MVFLYLPVHLAHSAVFDKSYRHAYHKTAHGTGQNGIGIFADQFREHNCQNGAAQHNADDKQARTPFSDVQRMP